MSITAYTGLPGAGKSYGVVLNVIVPALEAGRVVVTNIPLVADAISKRAPKGRLIQRDKKCTAQDWLDSPAGAVVVIDEAWNWWPAGQTADTIPAPQKSFYAEHRHKVGTDGNSTEIVLVTQDLSQLCAFVRALVEETFRCEKLTAIGSKNRFRVDCYQGAVTGQRPPKGQLVRQMFGKYDPAIFALYQSHTQSKTGMAGLEEKADKRGTVFGSFTIKAAIASLVLLPFGIWAAVNALGGFQDRVTGADKARSAQAATATEPFTLPSQPPLPPLPMATAPPALAAPVEPPAPKLSGRWRIIGVAVKPDGTGIALLKSSTALRRVSVEACKMDGPDLDMRCTLDNEVVTYFSGDTGGFASAAVANGVLSN